MLVGLSFLYQLPKKEKVLLEGYFFIHLYHELSDIFNQCYKDHPPIATCNKEKESVMPDANFLTYLINDILSTQEYSLAGIANFIRIPEEIIYDLIYGINKMPSSILWRKVIELHSIVRRDLYQELLKKIIADQKSHEPIKPQE